MHLNAPLKRCYLHAPLVNITADQVRRSRPITHALYSLAR